MRVFLSFLSLLLASVALAQPTGPPMGPANCPTSPTLMCLAGRTGTTNNPTISTSTDGIVTGSSNASTNVLKLRGNTSTSRTAAGNEVTFGDQVTSLATNAGAYSPMEFTAAPSFDTNISILNAYNTGEHRLYTINAQQAGAGGMRGFVYAPMVRAGADFDNSPAGDDMGHWMGLTFTPFFQSDSAKKATIDFVTGIYDTGVLCSTPTFLCDHATGDAATVGQWTGHWFIPTPDSNNATFTKAVGFLNNVNNTRGTVTELNTVEDEPTIGSGRTMPMRRGLYFKDKLSTGTQTEAYALDVADLTVGTRVAAVKSAVTSGTGKWHLYLTGTAPSLFGGAITGSESADGNLTIESTTNADPGTISIVGAPVDSGETIVKWAPTYTAASTAVNDYIFSVEPIVTNNAIFGTFLKAFHCGGTNTNTTTSVSVPMCVHADWTQASSSGSLPVSVTFNSSVFYTQAAAATTSGLIEYQAQQSYQTTAAVSSTVTAATSYLSKPTIVAAASGTQTITDMNHFQVNDIAASGAGTKTVTRQNGLLINALTTGAANLPIRIGEATDTALGNVPAGNGVIAVSSGAPNRVSFYNENQMRFDAGMTTWTGFTGAALAANNTTVYFPVDGRALTAAADGPGTEATMDVAAPGALTVSYMACAVNAAPNSGGGTQSRTFTLREAGAGVAPACTISETATSCTWCRTGTTGCSATGTAEAIAAGAMVAIEASASGTPTASEASCTLWWTLDAF